MKHITDYITEGTKYFKLEDNEREALTTFIGHVIGAWGSDEELKPFEVIKNALSEKELKQLDDVFQYVLDNDQEYPRVNRNVIIDEIPVILKVLQIAEGNDLLKLDANDNHDDWDLLDAYEKIQG